MGKYGVTHMSPDWDAIGSAWLASKYFEFGYQHWVFVSQKSLDIEMDELSRMSTLSGAAVVVDVGMIYNTVRDRYDHHQMPWEAQKNTCAMLLIWDALMFRGCAFGHLQPLVEFVTKGDTGVRTPEMVHSYTFGLHAELSAVKRKGLSDVEVLKWGFNRLYIIDDMLLHDHYLKQDLAEKSIWESSDKKIVCIKNGSGGLARKALEDRDLVVFINEERDTNTFGVQRREGLSWSCGDIVEGVLSSTMDSAISGELSTWYKHPSGFFAGRGTHGAKSITPIPWNRVEKMLSLIEKQYRRLT